MNLTFDIDIDTGQMISDTILISSILVEFELIYPRSYIINYSSISQKNALRWGEGKLLP